MKKLITMLLTFAALVCFSQGKNAMSVNPDGASSRSLTGSYVAFDPTAGGDLYYQTGGGTYNFAFLAYSYSPDWEYVYELWLQFPSGWVVNNVTVNGTPNCSSGTWGPFSWSGAGTNTADIYHPRYHDSGGSTCTAHYMVNVTIPGSSTGDADISWYWDGDGFASTPHNPCSSDQYTPPGTSPCDEWINPPAMVPYHVAELECLPGAIFSQPPLGFNNAYFSDESTYWTDQRIYENFSGLTSPIGGMTFWGVLWDGSSCYTGGSDDFVITFYQDNGGAVGSMVQSYPMTLTPTPTASFIIGAVLLRYDLTLPSSVSLSNGWVMVYRENPANSNCAFAWSNTTNGDYLSKFNQYGGSIITQPVNLAFCLNGAADQIPLSNWALGLGIFLILVFTMIRFRK